jgi:hypothetical protein
MLCMHDNRSTGLLWALPGAHALPLPRHRPGLPGRRPGAVPPSAPRRSRPADLFHTAAARHARLAAARQRPGGGARGAVGMPGGSVPGGCWGTLAGGAQWCCPACCACCEAVQGAGACDCGAPFGTHILTAPALPPFCGLVHARSVRYAFIAPPLPQVACEELLCGSDVRALAALAAAAATPGAGAGEDGGRRRLGSTQLAASALDR